MTVEEPTKALCPVCHDRQPWPPRFLSAELASDGQALWLRRDCPEHGEQLTLYEEDVSLWRARRGWTTTPRTTQADRPGLLAHSIPLYAAGLPEGHGQHTCILVLNVTEDCDLACPVCFASAGRVSSTSDPSIDGIVRTARAIIAREGGHLDVLMLSGGEPTVRSDLADLVDRLAALPITRLILNTNGLRLARDGRLMARLAAHRAHFEVYLQFDSIEPKHSIALRGVDLTAAKQDALAALDQAKIATTLVTTVVGGVNDASLSGILDTALAVPHVSGWALQPVFASGRLQLPTTPTPVTPTGLQRRLAVQTSGRLGPDDFIPLPCSHPDCCDLAFVVRDAADKWCSLVGLIGRDRLRDWLPLIGNTITFEELSAPVLAALRDGPTSGAGSLAQACCSLPSLQRLLGGLASRAQREPELLTQASRRALRITIKRFQDATTVREERLRRCCTHTGTIEPDPRRHSFCWRWLFGERQPC